jgi:glucose-1-phosphate cytidylyltransferase
LRVLKDEKALAVLCSYKLPFSYGSLSLENSRVVGFSEKSLNVFVNAGFYVLEPQVLDYVVRADCSFEREVLPQLAAERLLAAELGVKFWHPMDTPADHADLSAIYYNSHPDVPWHRK